MQSNIDIILNTANIAIPHINKAVRVSALYREINESKPHNITWPAKLDYNNPITSVYSNGSAELNFKLYSNEKTNLKYNGLNKHKFDPDSVSKIILGWNVKF